MQEKHSEFLKVLSRQQAIDMFIIIAHEEQWPTIDDEDIDPLCILALLAGMLTSENATAGLVVGKTIGYIQARLNTMFQDLTELKDSLELDDTALLPEKIEAMWESLEAWNGKALISED